MTLQSNRDIHTVSTTTLQVETPNNTALLDNNFTLVRYILPDRFFNLKDDSKYVRLHIALKSQLNRPYITFQNDRLDGNPQTVIYALYRHTIDNETPAITEVDLQTIFRFASGNLTRRPISCSQLELHLILKLLMTDYFHGYWQKAFLGQGRKYVYVSPSGEGFHKCLEIGLKGHRANHSQTDVQLFHITGHARRFSSLDENDSFTETWRQFNPVYLPVNQNEQTTLVQVPTSDTHTSKESLLKPFVKSDQRATLPYHNHRHLDRGRGKILYDFQRGFIQYLVQNGLVAKSQERYLKRFSSQKKRHTLPLKEMGKIYVLDQCSATEDITNYRTQFWAALKELYPQQVEQITQIPQDAKHPVLILQNYSGEDFLGDGIYADQDDPKQIIYRAYPNLPKQTLDIRSVAPKSKTPIEDAEDQQDQEQASLLQRLEVSLNELYLKDMLFNHHPIINRLPGYFEVIQRDMFAPPIIPLQKYAFLRKQTYDGVSKEILLLFENNHLTAYDLEEGIGKLLEVTSSLGLDWMAIYHELLKRQFKWDEETQNIKKGKKLVRYDIILLPGLALEVEDIHESVFYDYSVIEKNQKQNRQQYSVTRFQLPASGILKYDITQQQLNEYNDFLKKTVAKDQKEISYSELKKNYGKDIARLLDLPQDKKGKPRFQPLTKIYQNMNLLEGEKVIELTLTSQGIWFDDEGRYIIGDPEAIKDKQATAHKVRQITRLVGDASLDLTLLLSQMDVHFVRHKRFTVYPYQFKLIDLYVEMTQWSS